MDFIVIGINLKLLWNPDHFNFRQNETIVDFVRQNGYQLIVPIMLCNILLLYKYNDVYLLYSIVVLIPTLLVSTSFNLGGEQLSRYAIRNHGKKDY